MAAVQFYGKQQVIAAATNIDCNAWAIFSGKSLFMKYEGNSDAESEQLIEQALDMLMQSGTSAVYTIKFFEHPDGKEKIKINEKTVCDGGSFNFKLQQADESIAHYSSRGLAVNQTNEKLDKLLSIVEQQQLQIMELQEAKNNHDEDEEDEPETIGSVLIDAVKNPNKLMELVNTFKMITGIGMNYQQPAAAAIGNIPAANNIENQQQYSNEEMAARIDRLGAAITKLEAADPLLVEHLEKLAAMSENDPGMFKFLLSRL